MRQWFFILTGGLGFALMVGAVATIALQVPTTAPPATAPPPTLAVAEGTAVAGGAILGAVGYAGVRRSGRRPTAAWQAEVTEALGDLTPDVAEIAFDCPTCSRVYRAAAACVGQTFACRTCGAVFAVPAAGRAFVPVARAA